MGQISKIGQSTGFILALNHKDVEGLMLNVMIPSTPTTAQAAKFLSSLWPTAANSYHIDAFVQRFQRRSK
jgi:hypothetical protein